VSEVIDGDTIRTDDGVIVRYIGVDSPEISRENECGALDARERNKQLVDGRDVVLEKDISDKDKYGRLLRYVYVENEGKLIMVNHELVVGGFARSYPVSPDVKYKGLLLEAENKAKEGGLGLWGLCGGI
jgi:micrococcal nuclease